MKSGIGKAVLAGVSRAVSLVRMVIRPPKPAEKEVQKLWTYLKVFSITYAPVPGGDNTAVKVFANGRQQIPLRIVLSAWNDDGQGHEEYVHLTKETLDQLRLVNYIDGTHVLMHEGWVATFVQNEYTYDASVISDALLPGSVALDQRLPPAPVAADQVYRDIYVSVDHVETMRMAAEIAPPSKPAIQTRPGVSGGGPNSFDSSVTIVGRPTLEAVVSPGPGYDGFNLKGVKRSENDAVRVNDYYVSLIYRQRPVRLFSLQYDAAGPNIWWSNGDWGPWEGVFTLTSQPGIDSAIGQGLPANLVDNQNQWRNISKFYPTPRMYAPHPGELQVVSVSFKENLHFANSSVGDVADRTMAKLTVIDEFGNAHRLSISFHSDSYDDVKIAKW